MAGVHARKAIREAAAAAVTGLSTTGSNVFQSRTRPKAETYLLVKTNGEDIEPLGDIGDLLQRRIDIEIAGHAKDGATVDDTLDAIAAEVEVAMQAAGDLGGLIKAAAQLESINIDFDELEKPVGVVTLRYSALYITQAGVPGTSL